MCWGCDKRWLRAGLFLPREEEFEQCTELEFGENSGTPTAKSGEVWGLRGAQLSQHQRSAAALANRTSCEGGNGVEMT